MASSASASAYFFLGINGQILTLNNHLKADQLIQVKRLLFGAENLLHKFCKVQIYKTEIHKLAHTCNTLQVYPLPAFVGDDPIAFDDGTIHLFPPPRLHLY